MSAIMCISVYVYAFALQSGFENCLLPPMSIYHSATISVTRPVPCLVEVQADTCQLLNQLIVLSFTLLCRHSQPASVPSTLHFVETHTSPVSVPITTLYHQISDTHTHILNLNQII